MNINRYFEEIAGWPHSSHALLRAYIAGFVLSLIFTFAAYGAATEHILYRNSLVALLVVFALAQFLTQTICFLHLDLRQHSRERLGIFAGATLVVLILVSGSLWIMFSLNGRMTMNPAQMELYMEEQGGF